MVAVEDNGQEKRKEVNLQQPGTNSTDDLLCLPNAFCDMLYFLISLACYLFTFIQLLIKSFFYEDVFAILGITWSFLFNNNTVY